MEALKSFGLIYLATPYSRYPEGIEAAFVKASAITADLMRAGVRVYSPIAHTHPIAVHGKVDPYDHSIWMPFDEAIMERSDAILVVTMPTWEQSKGIAHEIEFFERRERPQFRLDPNTMEVTSWPTRSN